jgi:ATP-dependent Lon protease
MSPESGVIRNYLEWLIDMPWDVRTDDNLDVAKAKENLDNDHYGLKKVKERILEYLAVLKLVKNLKGPILCFVGPPGVGKTSLGRSIANTLNRKFVRVSLGGVRDEAEIRGHRRTYIGSMPGRIIQSIRKAKTKNPVFLLDEVDKMSMDFRGDPASALLEVLDPEQNSTFNDHFLDVDFDLSEVMFITTANDLYKIPSPLRDRMEIIRLPGYLDYEKLEIAKQFLIPKQLKNHGLSSETLNFTDIGIVKIINWYTKEAGVRNMEREIAKICRKVAKQIALKGKDITVEINSETLPEYLGVPKFLDKEVTKFNKIGTANGLAWTEHGGDILLIEVSILKGSGKIMLTGQLGDVMKESAKAAISYIRSRLDTWDIDENFYKEKDVHIHVPEGAIPKDGPSAGITIASALLSALTDTPTKYDVAMTGEITLRGDVLGIGGLNEKAVAAHRAGIKTIIVPKKNEKNMKELPDFIKKELDIRLVKNMDEVIKIVLAEKEMEN